MEVSFDTSHDDTTSTAFALPSDPADSSETSHPEDAKEAILSDMAHLRPCSFIHRFL